MAATAEQIVHEWVNAQSVRLRALWRGAYAEGQEEFRRQHPWAVPEKLDDPGDPFSVELPVDEEGDIIDDPTDDGGGDDYHSFLQSIIKIGMQVLPMALGTGIPYLDALTWFRKNERRVKMQADAATWHGQMKGYKDAGKDSGLEIEWELDPDAEHCTDCLDLAQGSPYTDDNGDNPLKTFPAAGDTECGASCKCSLNYTTGGAAKPALPTAPTLPEGTWEDAGGAMAALLAGKAYSGLELMPFVRDFRDAFNAALPEGWRKAQIDGLAQNSKWADTHKVDAYTEQRTIKGKTQYRIGLSSEQTGLLKYVLETGPSSLASPAAQDAIETLIHEMLHTVSPLNPTNDVHPLKWLLEEGMTEHYAREMFSDVVFNKETAQALKINLDVYKREVELVQRMEEAVGVERMAQAFQADTTAKRLKLIEDGLARRVEEKLRANGVADNDIAKLHKALRNETAWISYGTKVLGEPEISARVSPLFKALYENKWATLTSIDTLKGVTDWLKVYPKGAAEIAGKFKPSPVSAKGKSAHEFDAIHAWVGSVGETAVHAQLQGLVGWKKATALIDLLHNVADAPGLKTGFDWLVHDRMYSRIGTQLVNAGLDKAEISAMRSTFMKPLWKVNINGIDYNVDLYRYTAITGSIPWKGAAWSGDAKAAIQQWVTSSTTSGAHFTGPVTQIIKPVAETHFEAAPPIPQQGNIPRTWEGLTKLTKVEGPLGSQGGQWYQDDAGHRFLAKPTKDAAHAYNEWMSMQVYRNAGLVPGAEIPVTAILKDPQGKTYIVSQHVPDLTSKPADWWQKETTERNLAVHQAQEDWGLDVLLAHYDVVGAQWDNMLLNPNGQVVRIESGGAGAFRAMGSEKPSWGSPTGVKEDFSSMRGLTKGNPQLTALFGGLDDMRAVELLEKAKESINIPALFATLKEQVPEANAKQFIGVLQTRMNQVDALAKALRPVEPTTEGGKALAYYVKTATVDEVKGSLTAILEQNQVQVLFASYLRDPNDLMKRLVLLTQDKIKSNMATMGVGPTLRTEVQRILSQRVTNEKVEGVVFDKLTAYEKIILNGELPITKGMDPQQVFDWVRGYATQHGMDTALLDQIKTEGKIAIKVGPGGIPMVEGKEADQYTMAHQQISKAWNPNDGVDESHRTILLYQKEMNRGRGQRGGGYAEVARRSGVDQNTAREMLGSWAGSSSTEESLYVMIAVAQKFNLELAPWIVDNYNGWIAHGNEERVLARLTTARKLVDAAYDMTQETLKGWGLEEIPVYRGMRVAPKEFATLHPAETVELKDLYLNPLSSFAVSVDPANGWHGDELYSFMVPRERIMALPNLMGVWGEHEIVVIGGKSPIDLVQATRKSGLRNPYSTSKHLEQFDNVTMAKYGHLLNPDQKTVKPIASTAPTATKHLDTVSEITDAMFKGEKAANYTISVQGAKDYLYANEAAWVDAIKSIGSMTYQRAEWLAKMYEVTGLTPMSESIAEQIAKVMPTQTKPVPVTLGNKPVQITIYNADEITSWMSTEALVDSFTVGADAAKQWIVEHESQFSKLPIGGLGAGWTGSILKVQWVEKVYQAAGAVPPPLVKNVIKEVLGHDYELKAGPKLKMEAVGDATEQAKALYDIMQAGVFYDPAFVIPVAGAKEFATGLSPDGQSWLAGTMWPQSAQKAKWVEQIYKAAGVEPPKVVQDLLDKVLPGKAVEEVMPTYEDLGVPKVDGEWLIAQYGSAEKALGAIAEQQTKGLLLPEEAEAQAKAVGAANKVQPYDKPTGAGEAVWSDAKDKWVYPGEDGYVEAGGTDALPTHPQIFTNVPSHLNAAQADYSELLNHVTKFHAWPEGADPNMIDMAHFHAVGHVPVDAPDVPIPIKQYTSYTDLVALVKNENINPGQWVITKEVAQSWLDKNYAFLIKWAKAGGYSKAYALWVSKIYADAGKKMTPTIQKAVVEALSK